MAPWLVTRRVRSGFTLIEIAIVLAILGLLAVIAQSAFRKQMMKTHRAEAVVGLSGIHRAEKGFKESNGYYGDTFDEIGFSLDGGTRVDERTIQGRTYTFTLKAVPLDADPRGNFQGIATGDLDPNDGVLDILMVENGLTVGP